MSKAGQVDSAPKYIALSEELRSRIESGVYGVGERIPSEVALAEEMSVAVMTMRQAIHELANKGIVERRKGVGTFVCERTLGGDLAMLFFNMSRIVPQSLAWVDLESVREAAQEDGRRFRAMLMVKPYQDPEELAQQLRMMDIGAVGLLGFLVEERDYIAALSREIPCVLFNKEMPGLALPCAKPDLSQTARDVVDFFVSRGRTRIGVEIINVEHAEQRELAAAMQFELNRRGLPIDKSWWFESAGWDVRGQRMPWVSDLLARENRPDAMLVRDMESAYAIRAVLAERGERLGREMDLVAQAVAVTGTPEPGPWGYVSFQYDRVVRNAQKLLLETVQAKGTRESARVLVSETLFIPPTET